MKPNFTSHTLRIQVLQFKLHLLVASTYTRLSALVYGAGLLFVYALGRGVPIVLAGTFTGILKRLQAFGRWNEALEKVAGAVVIAVGLYFVWIA